MITEIFALSILALAAKADITNKHFEKREIPNAYFLPLPVLAYLNPASIPLTIFVAAAGILSWKYLGFGFADVLGLATVSLTGYGADAVVMSAAGIVLSEKTVYRQKEKFPALPGIFTGFALYLLLAGLNVV